MTTESDPWDFIDDAAAKLGVLAEARRKWRERGVPHRWRLPILNAASKAKVVIDQRIFDNPPDRRRRKKAA